MKNILHIVNIYFVLPYFLGDQLKYFKNEGYREHIICSESPELASFAQKMGADYKEVQINRALSPIADLRAIQQSWCYIRQNKIDIVVGHTPKGGLIAMMAGFLAKVRKRIYFRHGLVYETSTGFKRNLLIAIDRFTAALATDIVCVSPSVAKRSIKDGLNKEHKQRVLGCGTCNGIDIKRFSRVALDYQKLDLMRKELKINPNDIVIGFTGRLVKDKGIIELLEAFDILTKRYFHLKLLLVGMLEDRDALPKEVENRIKTDKQVIHTGYVKNEMIPYYYGLMDLFVLPSYREGFPTSVLEASAMELPVVTTRVTGCIDSIIEDETGYFGALNAIDLAKQLDRILCLPDKGVSMGKKGRVWVKTNFNSEVIWHEIEQLYQ